MLTSSYPRFPGDGVGTFLEPIAHGVAEVGHDVHVVAPWHPRLRRADREGAVRFHFYRYAPAHRWHVFGYATSLRADVSLRPAAYAMTPLAVGTGCTMLRRVARRVGAGLVHAHWVVPGGVMAMLAATGLPLVISLHGSDVYVAESNLLARRAARMAFRRAGAVTACSEDLRRRALALGAPADRTTVVPYGVDTQRFQPDPVARATMRARLSLSDDAPLLVTAGRLVRKKGIEYLIDALPTLLARWPDLTLAIVGDGDLRPELERRAGAAGVGAHVSFVGIASQDDVGRWMTAGDVVVIPSVRDDAGNVDGLPNTLLEALASGTPVVATRVGGIDAVVTDSHNARLVPERRSDALADAVNQLLAQPEHARALGETARRDMERDYTWETTARRLEDAYTVAHAMRSRRIT